MIWMGLAIGLIMGMVGTVGFLFDRGRGALVEMEENERLDFVQQALYWERECVEARSRLRIAEKKLRNEELRVRSLMKVNGEIAEGNRRLVNRVAFERRKYNVFIAGTRFSIS